jgi:glycosyltransferase involved in cell wall biosynthesis
MRFFPEHIKMLLEKGHTVELACNIAESDVPQIYYEWGLKVHSIPFSRKPLTKTNLKAYRVLKALVKEGQYDIVHTHTPTASMLTRFACRKLRKKGMKVFYTAHGFHFYKGAPKKNWRMYYPVEKRCAHDTDVLITMNQEDYDLARRSMKAKEVVYVPGVGIDIAKFSRQEIDREAFLKENSPIEIGKDDQILLSVGELIGRKNHMSVIRAIAQLQDKHLKYFICGEGVLRPRLEALIAELGLCDQVALLGYRTDIAKWCAAADLFVFPSFQEGMPVALMEAVASKTKVVCSQIRGNVELVSPPYLFDPHSSEDIAQKIAFALNEADTQEIEKSYERLQKFDIKCVLSAMEQVYFGKEKGE